MKFHYNEKVRVVDQSSFYRNTRGIVKSYSPNYLDGVLIGTVYHIETIEPHPKLLTFDENRLQNEEDCKYERD